MPEYHTMFDSDSFRDVLWLRQFCFGQVREHPTYIGALGGTCAVRSLRLTSFPNARKLSEE